MKDYSCIKRDFPIPPGSFAESRLFCEILNAEANKDLVVHVPHERIADLAAVVKYHVQGANDIYVTYTMCEDIGIKPAEALEMAKANVRPGDFDFSLLSDIISRMVKDYPWMSPAGTDTGTAYPVYVLSTYRYNNGAAALIKPQILESVEKTLGGSYLILPSSRHELIIIRDEDSPGIPELAGIVKEVNNTLVSPEDFLSDNVYRYDAGDGCVSIVS